MLDPNYLSEHCALSRSGQPNLEALFQALGKAAANGRVVLIIGAGISMDSGLPSWGELLRRMTDDIPYKGEFDLARALRADVDGPLRKAEQILSILRMATGFSSQVESVRRALYRDYPVTDPGPLAKGIASLIAENPSRISVITTNYDDVIDTACAEHGGLRTKVYGLKDAARWRDMARSRSSRVPILHVHGRLGRAENDIHSPVVLGETDFLQHGQRVQEIIRQEIEESVTLFLGLSLTDPNLIGPLWELAQSSSGKKRRPALDAYNVSVVGSTIGMTTNEAKAYAIVKSKYVDDALGLRTIFLKSYSQLDQLVHECRVAMRDPDGYTTTAADSIAYGPRFSALIRSVYDGLSSEGNPQSVLLDRLAAGLQPSSRILSSLNEFRRERRTRDRLSELRKRFLETPDQQPEERFALSLWLRNEARKDAPASYSIQYIGSSALIQSTIPEALLTVQIEPDSPSAPVRAIARGTGVFWNSTAVDNFSQWGGIVASRIRLEEKVAGLEIHTTIGALCLHSNMHYVGRAQRVGDAVSTISVLSALSATQRRSLLTSLERFGRDVVTEIAGSPS